ncbi:MAG: M3 family metallopeptidase [Candidatus Eisenbacteria bacterium]
MKYLSLVAIAAVVLSVSSTYCAAEDFEPISEADKEFYSFDLEKAFYADDAAYEADLDALVGDIEKLEALKGKVIESADNLYEAYRLSDAIIPVWWKLWVYSYLKYAINTDEDSYYDRIQKESGDLEGRIQFVKTETQGVDDETLEAYYRARPDLKAYAFAIEEARRHAPHTLSLPEEELLATLAPYLGPWSEGLYQTVIDRTDFPDIVVDGDTFDVNINYSALINMDDRDVRKDAWKGYFGSMAEHRDLYAFTIVKAMETRDKLAALRGFRNFPDSKFFDLYLTYGEVSSYFDEIANHAYLRKEYEKVRRARILADTGYDTVYIWDRTVQAGDFEVPRFEIRHASDVIKKALAPLGEEYRTELTHLLDPANRRLDIVGGEKRVPGMFSIGHPGGTTQFFSMSYNGYLTEVQGLAHESGHAVHHMLQTNAGVMPIYSDGPRYITESIAITNELLINYHLYAGEQDLKTKAYYLEQFLEQALGLLTNNMFANLELKMYEGVEDGTLKEADDFDKLAYDMVTPYSMYYGMHPEYKGLWAVIHHYFDAPMYNVNYVFSQAIALVLFDKIINEPGFVDKYVSLLKSGFDMPAPEMAMEKTGVDVLDPALLTSGFAFLEEKTQELRDLYARIGITTD